MFYLVIMDYICVKDYVTFIRSDVIIFSTDAFIPNILSVILSLWREAKLIFNDFLSENSVLSILFVAVSFCIWQFFGLCITVDYSYHLYQCQGHTHFSFVQDLPDFGTVVFHEMQL